MTGKRILVVDDDPSTRFLLRLILESAGYEVIEAANGIGALIHIKEALPDLVLTDMMMPVMDGATLIERLRSEARTAGLRVIAVSANPNAPVAAAHADRVLGKPFDRGPFLELVGEVLATERRMGS